MRVVLAMASGARGGGAEHLSGLAPELARRGVHVRAWVGRDGPLFDELRRLSVDAEPLELMHSRFDLGAMVRLRRRVANCDADLVHWHGTRAGFYGAMSGGRSVYTAHGLAYRKEARAGRRGLMIGAEAIACRADAVVSVSRTDLQELVGRRLVSPGRGFYIPNAVRAQRFKDLPSRAEARQALGVSGFVVGTTSRLVVQKGIDVALRALAKIGPHATFVVAGDGPLDFELKQLATNLGVKVRWLGPVDNVASVLPALDLFLLSSRWEGEPISLLEAMYLELPCVATDTEGARELLGGLGGLVPVDDVDAMAREIDRVRLKISEPDGGAAVREARARAESRTFEAMASGLERVYQLVVQNEVGNKRAL